MTTATQLERWGKANVPHFGGVFSSDNLPLHPRRPFRCVVNYDPSTEPGSHWLSIILRADGTGEFFDSYGVRADADGAFLHSKFHTHFKAYMDEHCKSWTFNRWDLQGNSRTCGQYALWFCHAGGGPETAPQYWQWASTDLIANDKKIQKLVRV